MAGSFVTRKEMYAGNKKWVVQTIVCAYLALSLIKIGSSLLVNEGDTILALRALSLLLSIVLGTFVWKGYTLARMILATWMTGVGVFCLYNALMGELVFQTYVVFLGVGFLWSVFGGYLFLLNRLGCSSVAQ